MGTIRKRFPALLITILLLCAACYPAVAPQESSDPASPDNKNQVSVSPETPPSVAEQQNTTDTKDNNAVETDPERESHEESDAAVPDDSTGQGNQAPATPQASEEPAASPNISSPADNNGAAPVPQDDGPVVLTISGDGVNGETTWTLNQLQALRDGYREFTYSTTNNWPSFGFVEAHGVSMTYLLRQAGVRSGASSIKLISTDGYYTTLTYNQVFGTQYSYLSHSASGSSGAFKVEPVVAWAWGDIGKVRPEDMRPYFGQSGPWEVNTASFVKNLIKIEVSTASAGTWAAPGASIKDGSTVAAGTELELSHGSLDSIRIYYTLDGSEPDYSSLVYNPSTSYFQPQLVKPLVLTESVTVKAFAAGLGKERSAVVSLEIKVD